MPRKMPCAQIKRSLSLLPMLVPLFLFVSVQPALASSSVGVFLSEPFVTMTSAQDTQLNSALAASATLLGGLVTGNARSVLGTGSLGVGMELLPGSLFGFYNAHANWEDTWTGSGSGGIVPVAATITLNGSITTSLLTYSEDSFQMNYEYNVGSERVLRFGVGADSSPARFQADANGVDISSLVMLTPNANPLLTDFSLSYTPILGVSSNGFDDGMTASIRVDGLGPMTLDAFHTFHVDLTSLDPNVTFSGEGGRTMPAVPEPDTSAMLLAGLVLLRCAVRRGEQKEETAA